MKRKLLSILLAVIMLIGVMPFSAFAGELPEGEPADLAPVTFIGQGGTAETADDYTPIDENCCLWQNGIYVAAGDITLSGSASVVGTVNLILCDGAKLTVTGENEGEAAIYVPEGSTLNIYGQKGSSGKLSAVGGDYAAGIGGCDTETLPALSNNCGTVNIYGAKVSAVGCWGAAGIGGGYGGSAESISVYGGIVKAECDEYYGSAIGSGEYGEHSATVLFAGGYTYAVGKIAVTGGDVTVADGLCVFNFDTPQQQFFNYGWRVGYESNPATDVLIGPCTYYENGTEKIFPAYIGFYNGETTLSSGFYFAIDDFEPDGKLTASGEAQLVLADGVSVDVTEYGRQTGNNLHVYTTSLGNAHGRMPGGLAFNEQGKTADVSIVDHPVYNGETALAAGTYYVTESCTPDDILTVTGKVTLILEDGVTFDLRNGGRRVGSNLRILTTSFGETKGRMLPTLMYNEQGEAVTVPDFNIYNGETELAAGTYYVSADYTVNGTLTANGKVAFLLADGVTLKADIFAVESNSSFEFYTESNGDEKGVIEGFGMSSHKYIDENGALCELPDGFNYYNGETTLESGWYFVSDKGCNERVTVNGTVHLVLADGADVLFSRGINVTGGNKLCIYAQSTGDRMGKVKFNAPLDYAAIGSGSEGTCGTVIINGGNIAANGGYGAAGIGGGWHGNGGRVTVNGGIVTANGGYEAAGIGGGAGAKAWSGSIATTPAVNTSGGSVTINGGFVTANGGEDAAGIGGGSYSSGADVTITGGTVWAYGHGNAVIGPGFYDSSSTNITTGSFYMANGLVAYCRNTDEWIFGPNRNISYFKGKSAAFIFDGHYYDAEGTQQMMTADTLAYNGETSLKKNRTYYVRESYTVNDPIFVPEGVTLILADGIELNAAKGLLVTGDSAPTILTQSLGADKGIFTGEIYYCYNNEGEGGKFPSGLGLYNGEKRLTQGYLVTEDVTAEAPILLDGNVSLFLYDGVTFNAAEGYLMTAGSTLTLYTLSKGENKGTFSGERLTEACGKTLPEYVKYYTGQTSPAAGWYYVQENFTLDAAMILRSDVHFIIPDGVTLDAPKGIYLTESASLDICPLSVGENAGRVTGQIFSEYTDGSGSHAIPDSVTVYAKNTTTLNSSYYLVLENNSVDVFSIPKENVTLLIADGVTLKGNAGYFGYEPNIGTFSTDENAGKFVGDALSYLDENGSSCLVPSDAHLYNGETVLTEGVWFAGSSRTAASRITVSGDVLLVLGDNATLRANRGITVAGGDTLTVTAQSEGDNKGKLLAYTFFNGNPEDIDDCDYGAAIGSNDDPETIMGTVVIWNGYVEAHGFSGGAGIGCETLDVGGTVTIYDGTVIAYGNNGGIGIGGDGTTVTIYGGNVFAYGDDGGKFSGIGFGGEGSVLNVLGGRVYARATGGKCAVKGASVSFGDKMRAAVPDTNIVCDDTLFSSVQSKTEEVLFFDASAVDENGDTVLFPESGRIYNGDTVLEEDTWYYVDESAETEALLIFRDGACMVLADGVTLNAVNGILCPASGVPTVYGTSNGENKGELAGTLLLPYLDSENAAHALPDDASIYKGQTELAGEWVYVDESCTLAESLSVRGNVNIVIADGAVFDAANGIAIEENGQLNVYFTSNGENKGVFIGEEKGYIDENGTQRDLPNGFAIYDGETVLTDNWYFVTADTVLDSPVEISGDVTLVIADGVTLTANKGILLADSNSLTVYAQSNGENAGALVTYGDKGAAGIGGDFSASDAGSLTVNGGNITAVGGTGAAGIGGGLGGSCADVVINNGAVTVTGGSGAKAIGGGTGADSDGTLAINESLAVEAGESAQSISAFEYNGQSFVKVTNHGEKYLCGIVGVSDSMAENITVTLTGTENSANAYNGETDGTNVYYVDNAANGTYLMAVTADGAVTRTYTVTVTDGRVVKSAELYTKGDVNGDGEITVEDYSAAVNAALASDSSVPADLTKTADYQKAVADLDGDGYVDVLDAVLLERKIYI